MSQAPIRRIRRDYEGDVWLIVADCPGCKRTHCHGGGTGEVPFLGYRTPDCAGTPDYDLTVTEDTEIIDGARPEPLSPPYYKVSDLPRDGGAK